jgi:hypothetical protein
MLFFFANRLQLINQLFDKYFTKFQINSLITNITSNTHQPPSSSANDYEQVKHAYNCDLNYPGELFPPVPMSMIDRSVLTFQQRLQELVGRRDEHMAQKIDSLLKESSPDKRFFFAVGFGKATVCISIESNEFVVFFLLQFI